MRDGEHELEEDLLPVTERMRVGRLPERQRFDRQALYDILDEGLVAHVGVVRNGAVLVLPFGYARDRHELVLHGSTGAGLLRSAVGTEIAASVTLVDGLVYARSLFDSSMNYRSAVVVGRTRLLAGDEKLEGLRLLSEHLMPGRWSEVRPPTPRELAATAVLRLSIDEASVKVRAGGPTVDPDDCEARASWAGVLPLRLCAGTPERSKDVPVDIGIPESVRTAHGRLSRSRGGLSTQS